MAHPHPDPPAAGGRKAEHLRIAGQAAVEHTASAGLEHVRLRHRALPAGALADVGLETGLLGARLAAPLLVSAMTGGTADAATVNRRLAAAAAEHDIALVLGSGRALLEDASLLPTYRPHGAARPPLLLANLGAAQARGPQAAERAERLVELLGADGLTIHLNPVQEAVQPEGEPDFSGVVEGIAAIAARLAPRPLVVKEVGFGLDVEDVRLLAAAGVAAVDVAGAGGTNWALIEGRRDARAGAVAAPFAGWGTPTGEALAGALAAAPGLPVIASGGLWDGVDVAKCLALGAAAAGLARPFLLAAQADCASEAVGTVLRQLRIATWAAGAPSAAALGSEHVVVPAARIATAIPRGPR
jgi:isopentenyl-diphosphate delta-isomerase